MAGVKITDLVTITEAATDDLLYIVDVSNTSQSPEGTSSQIEVGNMFSSGVYTPTVSGALNLIATSNYATFIKVGNIVHAMIQVEITLDPGEDDGEFELSLPVASNFTNAKQLFGLMQFSFGSGTTLEIIALDILAETTNNTCFVDIETLNAEALMEYCALTFQYEVL